MKKFLFYLVFVFQFSELLAQPYSFSWKEPNLYREYGFNYISPVKDQGEQGPCGIFAAIGGIEAMSQIYYHKPSSVAPFINLSEAEMYSKCSQYGRFDAAASVR